ncbi:hypothetical protein ACFL96_11410 [Thermoproteota archaeon]
MIMIAYALIIAGIAILALGMSILKELMKLLVFIAFILILAGAALFAYINGYLGFLGI